MAQRRKTRQRTTAPRRPRRPGSVLLYGRHAVQSALANPNRKALRLHATERALTDLAERVAIPASLPVETLEPKALSVLAPPDAPAQGLLLEAAPLPARVIDDAAPSGPGRALVLALDRVEDPQNVGAILRSAAAFGARALVTQDRHTPSESGALAKAASGALDIVPWIRVPNLAAALARLAELGYWRVGLEGSAQATIGEADLGAQIALVLGAEGKGLRPLTVKNCDHLARIPIAPLSPLIDSLNVSNAAAVALYALAAGSK